MTRDNQLSLELRSYAYLARTYIGSQEERIACDHRIAELKTYDIDGRATKYVTFLAEMRDAHHFKEKESLKKAYSLFSEHPLWDWCQAVKGLGPVAALTFLGYINPYVATTASKVWKYAGLVPTRPKKFNRRFKGRVMGVIVKNIILKKDSYYYPLYIGKKQYYLVDRGMQGYIDDPSTCPDYKKCVTRNYEAARRQGRKPKRPSCRAHADNRAKRVLGKLLCSHALEIMRVHEGLPVDAMRSHRDYIAPKPFLGAIGHS